MQVTSLVVFDERRASKEWNFPNITRPFSIIYYVLGGTAYYSVDEEEKEFKKGHLYILPANRVYSMRQLENDVFFATFIHAYTFPVINDVVDIDVSDDEFMTDTIELLRSYVKKGKRAMLYVHRITDMLIAYISQVKLDDDTPLQERVKEYTEENYVSVFRDNDLSQRFNYSNSYISKLFKSEYNVTPKQYAKQLILREITDLLHEGTPIADIAHRLAFSSPENLCRFFKASYGCAPTDYIRSFKKHPFR